MNYRMIARILGMVLLILAALLVLPLIAGLCYGENVLNFAVTIAAAAALGGIFMLFKPKNRDIYAREGFTAVGLSWILMSLIGALPFVISGDIPSYVDALFETVSGFTTTGSTLLTDIEAMSRGCMFWRMFTHWIGGMGVLVFIMAVLPMSGEHSMHIMRAEIPGPVVGKLVPRARKTAAILYIIYMGLTAIETVFLLCGGMSFYDAMLHAFATAGTGGFSTRGAGIAAFDSLYIEVVISVFMLLFAVNFNLYFLLLMGRVRDVLKKSGAALLRRVRSLLDAHRRLEHFRTVRRLRRGTALFVVHGRLARQQYRLRHSGFHAVAAVFAVAAGDNHVRRRLRGQHRRRTQALARDDAAESRVFRHAARDMAAPRQPSADGRAARGADGDTGGVLVFHAVYAPGAGRNTADLL